MERFNGIALEDIAPVIISGVYIDPPKVSPKWEDKPIYSGSHFIRTRYENRKITIRFYLPVKDAEQRAEYIAAIAGWAHSTTLKKLETSKRQGKYIMAMLSKLPSPSEEKWEEMLDIQFESGDPFFVDSEYKIAPVGTSFQVNSDFGIADDAYIAWANPSTATSPAWVLDGVTTIAISGSVAAGDVAIIVSPIAATLDGVSIQDQVTLASRPFQIGKGSHVISGNGALVYRERVI